MRISLVILLVSSLAFADKVKAPAVTKLSGPTAKQLIRALKLAGVKPTTAKESWTYSVKALMCHTASADDDGLGMFDCEADKLKIEGAPAYLLDDAMFAAKMPDDAGMSQTHVRAKAVTCVDDQGKSGDAMYACSFTAP